MNNIAAPDLLVVDEISAESYVVPTDGPESDGTLAWDSTGLVLVRAASGGLTGIGWSYAAPAAAGVVRDMLAPVVVGMSAMDVPAAANAMARSVRNIGRAGIASTAISAVDVALWDLKARVLGVSVAGLLGRAREDVPVYGSGGFISYDDHKTQQQLAGWVEKLRIPRVKIKIGEDWGRNERRDLDRVRLAREVIGPDTELYVDANGGYQKGQAVRVGWQLAYHGVSWFEEPVSSQYPADLAEIRGQVSADVTAGEYSWTLVDSARLLDAGAVDCLQLDATRCGGFTGFAAAAALAAAHGVEVSAHCAPNLHAQVAAATQNLRHVEYFHDHQRIEQMLFDGALDPSDGVMRPDPSRLGLGVEFKTADAERFRRG